MPSTTRLARPSTSISVAGCGPKGLIRSIRAYPSLSLVCTLIVVPPTDVSVLRHALAESGADELIKDLLARDAIVYGGYSAGVCVLPTSLRGLEVADEPEAVAAAYGATPRWDGLGVLDWYFVPHYRTPDHPETAMSERLAEHYEAARLPHRKLHDGQAIVIDGGTERLV